MPATGEAAGTAWRHGWHADVLHHVMRAAQQRAAGRAGPAWHRPEPGTPRRYTPQGMALRILSLALAWLVLCSALAPPDTTVSFASSTTGQSGVLAAGDASQPLLPGSEDGGPLDDRHAQWHAEGAGDPHELLRTGPVEASALLGGDCHGPFVGSVLSAPYLDGLQRPPCAARLAA